MWLFAYTTVLKSNPVIDSFLDMKKKLTHKLYFLVVVFSNLFYK